MPHYCSLKVFTIICAIVTIVVGILLNVLYISDHSESLAKLHKVNILHNNYFNAEEDIHSISWNDIFINNNMDSNLTARLDENQLLLFLQNFTSIYSPNQPIFIPHSSNSYILKYWKILQKWIPNYFNYGPVHERRSLGIFEVYHQSYPIFKTFHDSKPLEKYMNPLNTFPSEYFNTQVWTNSFARKIFNENESKYYAYFVQSLNDLQAYFPGIEKDILPYFPFTESAFQPMQELMNEYPEANLNWSFADLDAKIKLRFSNAGQETYMHFDSTWNFFIQVFGRKTFILASPNTILYKYPCLHPHSGHSQLAYIWNCTINDLESCEMNTASNDNILHLLKNQKRFFTIVDLKAGDILLIPSFWWHHTLSVSNSISMHFWMNSVSYLLANEKIYAIGLPFEYCWSLKTKMYLLRLYLNLVITHLSSVMDSFDNQMSSLNDEWLFNHLWNIRYQTLYESKQLLINETVDDIWRDYNDEQWLNWNERLLQRIESNISISELLTEILFSSDEILSMAEMLDINKDFTSAVVIEQMSERLLSTAMDVVQTFHLMKDKVSILHYVQNYIEYCTNAVLGTQHVVQFIKFACCLNRT